MPGRCHQLRRKIKAAKAAKEKNAKGREKTHVYKKKVCTFPLNSTLRPEAPALASCVVVTAAALPLALALPEAPPRLLGSRWALDGPELGLDRFSSGISARDCPSPRGGSPLLCPDWRDLATARSPITSRS